jgi:peptidoglycan/xylan/chitin deacetylase (PgdA/CDA1 family)
MREPQQVKLRSNGAKGRRGKLGRRLVRRAKRLVGWPAGPAILMYHRVAPPKNDPWGLAVSPAAFEAQMRWLKRRRTVLPLHEFAGLHDRGRLPRDAVAVTFDDGYACNKLVAAPILAANQVPATIFLTTGAISSPAEFWWDDLERIIAGAQPGSVRLVVGSEYFAFQITDAVSDESFGDNRAAAHADLWRAMRELDAEARNAALVGLADRCGVGRSGRKTHRAMTRAELTDLARSPWISFGAHTVSHPPLSKLSAAEQRYEIEASRSACAALTGAEPAMFAYPYGDNNEETVRLVREAGFTVAVTTEAGTVSKSAEMLRLPRIQIGDWSEDQFAKAISSPGGWPA